MTLASFRRTRAALPFGLFSNTNRQFRDRSQRGAFEFCSELLLGISSVSGHSLHVIHIYIDADACPVKDETYKVAARYQIKTFVVANQYQKLPPSPLIEMKVVSGDFDAADDWIVEQVTAHDIVITTDILLADRCVRKKARVLGHKGIEFTEDNVGSAVATRELMQNLRHMGEMRGGPAPIDSKARSQYLGKLDQIIQSLKKK